MESQKGFSLIEVLVSLALLSFAALSGFILIDSLSRVHTRLDERFARLEALQIFLADFSQDVSSAEKVAFLSSDGALTLETSECDGSIQYKMHSGVLVRDVAGCPEHRFELSGLADARFSVISAGLQASPTWPPPGETALTAHAVRLDLTFGEQSAGLNIQKVVDLPAGPAP